MKRLMILCISSICFLSQAQGVKLTWSEPTPNLDAFGLIGNSNSNSYVYLIQEDHQLGVKVFDQNSKELKSGLLSMPLVNIKKYTLINNLVLNSKIFNFIVDKNKKTDLETLYLIESDLNLNTKAQPIILDEWEENTFKIALSPDSTKILVTHFEGLRKENGRLKIKVYDSNFKTLSVDKTIEVPYSKGDFRVLNPLVDNLGNIAFLAQVELKEKENDSKIAYRLLQINGQKLAINEVKIKHSKFQLEHVYASVTKANDILVVATSKEERGSETSNFLSTFIINPNDGSIKQNKELSIEDWYLKKGRLEKKGHYIPKIYYSTKDNGYIILLERYLKTVVRTSRATYTDILNADVFCLKLNSSLELEHKTKIAKIQLNEGAPSFVSTYYNDNIHLFYNDQEDNLNKLEDLSTQSTQGNLFSKSSDKTLTLTMAKIDPNGALQKKIIYGYKNIEIITEPLGSFSPKPNTIILKGASREGLFKAKYHLGTLLLD